MFRPSHSLLCVISALLATSRADVTFVETADRVSVKINGALFTDYHHGDASHVYYWPVIGPGGAKMTRSFPMETIEGEAHDHPHHRSLWFSHGNVNGVDFWAEAASSGGKPPKQPLGAIEHVKVLSMEAGKESGTLKTSQKWTAPDGSVPLTSVQVLRVHAGPETERMFDFEVTLTAGDKDAVFGDTKEGSAAIRIAESMRFKQPKAPGEGHILNDSGVKDDKVWGQHAKWVTMSGPIAGKPYAITFMDHPSNLRHPTRWHARDYGLFAANPFCEADMDKTQAKGAGNYTLKAGQSMTFKYRFLITEGEEAAAKQEARYKEYTSAVR